MKQKEFLNQKMKYTRIKTILSGFLEFSAEKRMSIRDALMLFEPVMDKRSQDEQ
jgi:hypothetical protein